MRAFLQGGVYHGRIIVPPDYPMKPPDIIVLTVSFVYSDDCRGTEHNSAYFYFALMW
jgi:ubiquitin-protein ligase